MTYIDYLNDFNQWLETNPLPASSQLMYFKLLNIFNRAGWPEEVGVDNLRLQMMLDGAAKTTVVRARDKLVEAGFIAYKKGRKGFPNRYALTRKVSIFATESATVCATENATVSATINATHIKTKDKDIIPPLTPPSVGRERKRFVPPTAEQVREYCTERQNGIDPEAFVAFYASKGWVVGKSPMKDWKAAVRTWEQKRKQESKKPWEHDDDRFYR